MKFSVPQLHWLSSRCGFVFIGRLWALAQSQPPSQQRPITGWGCGCLLYLRAHSSAQNRNTSFCQCRIESVLLQPVFLTVRVKRMKEHFRQFAVGDVRITQLKLLGCNATFFSSCVKTWGANLEQCIIWMPPPYRATSPGIQSSPLSACYLPMHISWNQRLINWMGANSQIHQNNHLI